MQLWIHALGQAAFTFGLRKRTNSARFVLMNT